MQFLNLELLNSGTYDGNSGYNAFILRFQTLTFETSFSFSLVFFTKMIQCNDTIVLCLGCPTESGHKIEFSEAQGLSIL